MPKLWGYIGPTKIMEINPEKKQEAFERGLTAYAELRLKDWKKGKIKISKCDKDVV